MATNKEKHGDPVERVLLIYEALVRNVIYGLSNREISDAIRSTAVNTSRDMQRLEELGWVRRLDSGKWVLTVKPIALMKAYDQEYHDMLERAKETDENSTAAAMRYRS